MKIKFGDKYFLNTDRFNWWISTEKTNKKGDVVEKNLTGYYGKLEDVLEAAVRVKIKTADVKTLDELMKNIKTEGKSLLKIVRELEKKFKIIDETGDEESQVMEGEENESERISEFGDEDL